VETFDPVTDHSGIEDSYTLDRPGISFTDAGADATYVPD
jgi:hypothetical protein